MPMNRSRQMVLDLPVGTAMDRADFIVDETNRAAVTLLEDWNAWPVPRLVLAGPAGSGKSHLARIWAASAGAAVLAGGEFAGADAGTPLVIEDADRYPRRDHGWQEALFHLHNAMAAAGLPLLLTVRTPPARWGLSLADLQSRLSAIPVAQIGAPGDGLLLALLAKLFADRQIAVSQDLLVWLLRRMHRSANAARQVVDRLDRAALAEGRAVTRAFAGEILGEGDWVQNPS